MNSPLPTFKNTNEFLNQIDEALARFAGRTQESLHWAEVFAATERLENSAIAALWKADAVRKQQNPPSTELPWQV